MELKKHFDTKVLLLGIYVLCFVAYLIYGLTPVEASSYAVDAHLVISSIGLSSDVTEVEIRDGNLPTPDTIVGSYPGGVNKTFLFGHSSAVFSNLDKIQIGDELIYEDVVYEVTSYDTYKKSDVDMSQILSPSNRKTIVLMTCAGENYGNGDSSHRLVINAISR